MTQAQLLQTCTSAAPLLARDFSSDAQFMAYKRLCGASTTRSSSGPGRPHQPGALRTGSINSAAGGRPSSSPSLPSIQSAASGSPNINSASSIGPISIHTATAVRPGQISAQAGSSGPNVSPKIIQQTSGFQQNTGNSQVETMFQSRTNGRFKKGAKARSGNVTIARSGQNSVLQKTTNEKAPIISLQEKIVSKDGSTLDGVHKMVKLGSGIIVLREKAEKKPLVFPSLLTTETPKQEDQGKCLAQFNDPNTRSLDPNSSVSCCNFLWGHIQTNLLSTAQMEAIEQQTGSEISPIAVASYIALGNDLEKLVNRNQQTHFTFGQGGSTAAEDFKTFAEFLSLAGKIFPPDKVAKIEQSMMQKWGRGAYVTETKNTHMNAIRQEFKLAKDFVENNKAEKNLNNSAMTIGATTKTGKGPPHQKARLQRVLGKAENLVPKHLCTKSAAV